MSNVKISALPTASGIDGSADYMPIVQSSTTNKINRNTLLGITGAPLGTTDSQSVSNKTLGNTNTITLKDTLFTLQDDGDTTKQAKFQLSGITAGQTRTYTMPNASVTLASLTGTETLTNKTITSPAITGGTIDNSTITVDSISGHTVAANVTVGGVAMHNGVISTASAVDAISIAAGGVQPQALQSGTGTSWAWSSWTPTPTNWSNGNGTLAASYIQTGKTVHFRLRWLLGSTSAVTGSIKFTLPVAAVSGYIGIEGSVLGSCKYIDLGNAEYFGFVQFSTASIGELIFLATGGTYASEVTTTASIPGTWSNGDELWCIGTYEAA